jgi:hypothetical protein
MKRIIKQREIKRIEEYGLFFESRTMEGAGYSFDCDKEGRLTQELTPIQQESWKEANNLEKYYPGVVQDHGRNFLEPAVLECHCGHHIALQNPHENGCEKCGRAYNLFGQEVIANYSRQDAREDGVAWDESEL